MRDRIGRTLLALSLLALALGCRAASPFPAPHRPVAPVVSAAVSDERTRDQEREAGRVLERLGVGPGMRVADIGAGEGYYTVRIAPRVGPSGVVYATDIDRRRLSVAVEMRAEVGFRNESEGLPVDGMQRTGCEVAVKGQCQELHCLPFDDPAQLGMAAASRGDGKAEGMEDLKDLASGQTFKPRHRGGLAPRR